MDSEAAFTLRPATQTDFPAIRQLIQLVGINPMSPAWRPFVVAVDASGRLLPCGFSWPHGKELIELASIAVEPAHPKQGIARGHYQAADFRRRQSLVSDLQVSP